MKCFGGFDKPADSRRGGPPEEHKSSREIYVETAQGLDIFTFGFQEHFSNGGILDASTEFMFPPGLGSSTEGEWGVIVTCEASAGVPGPSQRGTRPLKNLPKPSRGGGVRPVAQLTECIEFGYETRGDREQAP